jgi:hypothetical protein
MYRQRQLGDLGEESYWQALWATISHPLTANEVLTGNPNYSALPPDLLGGLLTANAFGILTSDQKQQLVNQEAKNLVMASANTLSLADATTQAKADITNILSQAGANPPPESTSGIPSWFWWALGGIAGVVVIAKLL